MIFIPDDMSYLLVLWPATRFEERKQKKKKNGIKDWIRLPAPLQKKKKNNFVDFRKNVKNPSKSRKWRSHR